MTTTRETADHAELARTLEALAVEASASRNIDGAESMMVSVQTIYDLIVNRNALLSEIAALRGELAQSKREYRDDVGKHIARAAQAKRQRDELRKAMPDLSSVIAWLDNGCEPKHAVTELVIYKARIDQAIANQGADQ